MPKETKKRLKQRKQNTIAFIIVSSLIFVASVVTLTIGFVTFHYNTELEKKIKNSPKQSVQVEVSDKKIIRHSNFGKGSSTHLYIYIVSFKFPDGSIKELEVDFQSYRRSPKNDPDSLQYDFLTVGDIGILTYKESEEHVKNGNASYGSRLFISFEKNPEYGGLTIVVSEKRIRTVWDIVFCFVFTVASVFVSIFGMIMFVRLRHRQKPRK